MDDTQKTAAADDELDKALEGTFPASDPVSPPSHVEEEMERRRAVLEQDRLEKERERGQDSSHTERALDEALRQTFPASDPVSVAAAVAPEGAERKTAKTDRKKRAARRQKKTPRRRNRPAGKKKAHSKKPKRSAPNTRRKKAPRKKSARRKTRA